MENTNKSIKSPIIIDKKNVGLAKNIDKKSEDFRKLIAEIIVEIIISRQKNGCNRICKNK
ncbi:hypothetical protein GJU39_06195 [Pedobacter petrophilus]|uniref:Uncharacterized protein n=1 Tax=Pedobacter petrophilus TaxID=1908241 RepID=A0A7K0FX91_9SPHI|nr:hypothetical protein [Pedobacter petrophilus]MRX75674.1 hypothetical protein [Pedobacter petrophilus]